MIDENVFSEKLKYLVMLETKQRFEISKLYTTNFGYSDYPNNTILESYDVDMTFDFNGRLDGEVNLFGGQVEEMCQEIEEILVKYGLDKRGSLNTKSKRTVFPAVIWEINYVVDTTHVFNLTYRVVIDE